MIRVKATSLQVHCDTAECTWAYAMVAHLEVVRSTDVDEVRRLARGAGWSLELEGGSLRDYCPSCTATRVLQEQANRIKVIYAAS